MLTDGLDDLVRFEAQTTHKTIFWACQKRAFVNFEQTVNRTRNTLDPVAISLNVVPLVDNDTAFAWGTNQVLAVFHHFEPIELFIDTVWNCIQFILWISAFLDIIDRDGAILTAGDDVGMVGIEPQACDGVALPLGLEDALSSSQIPQLHFSLIITRHENMFINKLAPIDGLTMRFSDYVCDLPFRIDKPEPLVLRARCQHYKTVNKKLTCAFLIEPDPPDWAFVNRADFEHPFHVVRGVLETWVIDGDGTFTQNRWSLNRPECSAMGGTLCSICGRYPGRNTMEAKELRFATFLVVDWF